MTTITISVVVFMCIIAAVIILTWWVVDWFMYKKLEKQVMKMEKCPFKTPCLRYDEMETKAAVKRVAKLILVNMEKEELKKSGELYKDLASGKIG